MKGRDSPSSVKVLEGQHLVGPVGALSNQKEKQMKRYSLFGKLCLLLCLVVPMFLGGCSGDNGSTGATGATGATGPQGPAGPPGASATAEGVHYLAAVHNGTLTISSISLTTNAANQAVVTFSVADADANPVAGISADAFTFILADEVPAGTSILQPRRFHHNLQHPLLRAVRS